MELTTWLPCSALLVHKVLDPRISLLCKQEAGQQQYLTPAAIQLNLRRWVPMLGQKGAQRALAQHLASILPFGAI